MNLRWHRSRLFWSGLTGLVMLVAAWIGSYGVGAGVSWGAPDWRIGIGKYPQTLIIGGTSYGPAGRGRSFVPPLGLDFSGHYVEPRHPGVLFVPVVEIERWADGKNVHFAIWAIVTAYLVLWVGTLVWWQRRKHRLMNPPRPTDVAACP